jgi:hypothetical protein
MNLMHIAFSPYLIQIYDDDMPTFLSDNINNFE